MRDNEAEPDSNDFLVLPGSNRNPPKSNVLARANQIRAALQSVDNEQLPHHYQSDLEQLQTQHYYLQIAYQNLQRFLAEQQETEHEHTHQLEGYNMALREELQKVRSQQPEKNYSSYGQAGLSIKYEKALKEIATLMSFNKELKAQLEYVKSSSVDKQEFQRMYGDLMDEKNEAIMVSQREYARLKEVESANIAYQSRLQEMQSALNEQQEQYEHEVGKLVNVINSYGADAEKLRKRAEKCDLLEQQLQDRHNIYQSKLQELEQLRTREAAAAREIHQLKQLIDQLQVYEHQRQMMHYRELEGLKQRVQDDGGKTLRSLQDQLVVLKQENSRLQQSKQELEAYSEGLLEYMRRKSNSEGANGYAVEEMKRYISTLRTETNKLREVLASKDQLLADKSGLNKEVVAQNRQIAALTHDNAQLKLLVEGAQAKEATLLDTIRRLEIKVEEERQEAVKLKQSFSDSRLFSPVSATANYPEGYFQRLVAENDSLRQRLAKALYFTSLEKVAAYNRPTVIKPERPIPLNIRIRYLRVLLELIISGSGNSTVTMETAQLTDLKTFTVEFEERLKLLSNENDHLKKKVQDYRHKYHESQREAQSVENENASLLSKVDGYEKLVQKLYSYLERSIKKAQQAAGQMTLSSLNRGQLYTELRIQLADLNEKLYLQGKYLGQQMQTRELEYYAKLVAAQKRLDSYQQEIESVALYTTKIQELSEKLVRLEMLNNEYKVQLAQYERTAHGKAQVSSKTPTDSNLLLKQVYDKLAEREAQVLKLDYNLKERQSELQERFELENYLKQQLYESDLEIYRLKEVVRTAQQGEYRIASEAKRMDQYQQRRIADLQKQNSLLQSDVQKLQSYEEELATERHNFHLLKVTNVQNTERITQLEAELSRLRTVEHSIRYINAKYSELQNTSYHSKSGWEGEKARLERQLKDKETYLSYLTRFIAQFKYDSANEIYQLRNNLGKYEAESESLRRNSEVTRYKTTEVEDENNRLRLQINLLNQYIERHRQTESRVFESDRKLVDVGINLDSTKHKLEFATKENQRLKQRIIELEETLSRGQNDINDRERIIRTQKNEMLDLSMKIEYLNFKNGSLRSEVERMQKVVDGVVQQSLQNSRRVTASNSYREYGGGTVVVDMYSTEAGIIDEHTR